MPHLWGQVQAEQHIVSKFFTRRLQFTQLLIQYPAFRLYLPAVALSMFGDSILLIALGVWVKALTGNSSAAGTTFLLIALPGIAAPVMGPLVDRFRRKPFLVFVNALSAVAILPLLLVNDTHELWIIYAVAVLYGTSFVLIEAAQNGLYKTVFAAGLLADANGAMQTVRESLRLIGPLIGAGLFALYGARVLVVVDAVTFIVAAAAISRMSLQEPGPRKSTTAFPAELLVGARYIWTVRDLRAIVAMTALAYCAIGFIETIGFVVNDKGLHRPPAFLGVLVSVQGIGALVGGATAASLIRRLGEQRSVGLGQLAFGIAMLTLITHSLAVTLAGMVLIGVSLPWMAVGYITLIQRSSPSELMGRVSTSASFVVTTPQVVSIGVGAAAVAVVDYRILLVLMAVVLALAAAYLGIGNRRPLSGRKLTEPGGTSSIAESLEP